MNIREFQLAVEIAKHYLALLNSPSQFIPLSFRLTRSELVSIMKWKYSTSTLQKKYMLETMSENELYDAIGDASEYLLYFIEEWGKRIQNTPSMSKSSVSKFFEEHALEMHYLYFKPVETWDEYDQSNFYSLMLKHGKVKKVYAIYMADVNDDELHLVSTPPAYFFDSYKEADIELKKILAERGFNEDELKIKTLFKIN